MGSIIDRLQEFIEAYGLNNNSLTVKAGLSVGLLAQAIKNRKGLHSDTIQKILNTYPEVSAEWFVMGRGAMRRAQVQGGPAVTGAKRAPFEDLSEAEVDALRALLRERKRTSPVAVAVGSRNGDGAKMRKS